MQLNDKQVAEARQWLVKAAQDLQGAELMEQSPALLGIAAFHCQQAVEKALKGFLSLHNRPFRRTHDLTELLRQCIGVDAGFARHVDRAALLSPYAGDFRYPGDVEDLSPAEAAAALRAAREVLDFVRARFPEAGQP